MRRPEVISESPAQLAHTSRDDVVTDRLPRPDLLHNLGFGDHASVACHQEYQQIECLGAEMNRETVDL
jgi:hypothetical protein